MKSSGKGPVRAAAERAWPVWIEEVLIWASILALWPWILRGRWLFNGWWVTALLWAALAAMTVVAVRRVRRLLAGARRQPESDRRPSDQAHADR